MAKGKKIELDEKELRWLDKHFMHTINEECAAHLGISMRSVVRIARKRGLKKSRQFMRKCQRATADAAKASHLRNGTYPPKGFVIPNREATAFKKGETPLQRLGKRKNDERIRKATDSRERTRKSERARATFGLPQRTRLRVIPVPTAKINLRWYLKSRGYMLDEKKGIAYYDENTKRGKRIESKPQRWYSFQELRNE